MESKKQIMTTAYGRWYHGVLLFVLMRISVHICIVSGLPFYLFWVKTVKVDEVWSESVEDGSEGETVLP